MYGLGAVGIVALSAVLWLGSGFGEEWVRAKIEQSITSAMSAGSVELESVSTNGFSHVGMRGLEVVDASGNGVVTLGELVVDFNPLAIILGRISVGSVVLSGLDVAVDLDESGVPSLAKMFVTGGEERDSGATPLDMVVKEFAIRDLTVRYSETPVGTNEQVEHVLELELQGAFNLTEGASQVEDLVGRASVDGVDVELQGDFYSSMSETRGAVELAGIGSRLVGTGSYSPVLDAEESWEVSLSELELDLQRLGEFVDVPLVGRVVAAIEGRQNGGIASISGDMQHDAGGLVVTGELTPYQSTFNIEPRSLSFTDITPLVNEPVVLTGALHLSSETLVGLVSPEISLELEDSIIWGVEISSATLAGRYAGGELIVDEFVMLSPLVSASASGVVGELGLDMELALSEADLRQFQQFGAPYLTGTAATRGHLSANWEQEEIEVDWEGSVSVRQFTNTSATFRGLTGPVTASVRGDSFSASGESEVVGLSAGGTTADLVALQWTVDDADSLEWSSTVSVDSLSSGDLLVSWMTGRLAGSGDSVHGRMDMTLINGFTQVWPSGTLRFDLADTFRFRGSILGGGSNELALDIVSDRGFTEFELNELSVALGDQPGWSTTGSTRIRRGGDSLAVRGLEFVSEAGGAIRLDATGSMSGPISANLHLAQFPLDWVEPIVGDTGYGGLISGDVIVGGRSDALRIEADLSGVGLRLPNTVTGLDSKLSLRADDESFRWGAEIVRAGVPLAELSGHLPLKLSLAGADLDWSSPFVMDGVFAPVSNSHWREGVPALSMLPEGRSSASISLAGTLREPLGEINAGIAWRLGSDNRQFRIDLGVELDEAQVDVVGSGRTGGVHLFDLRGAVSTAIDQALSSIAGDDVEFPAADEWVDSFEIGLAPMGIPLDLLRGFAPLPEALDGLVSGSVSLVGGASEPRAVVGVSLSEGSFGKASIPSAIFSLVPGDDHYDLSLFGSVGLGSLVVTGSVPFGDLDTEGLALEIAGPELPMELMTGLVPEMSQVTGSISMEGQVRGSISAPMPRVAATLVDGGFVMPNLGVAFSQVVVDAVLSEAGVDIQRFSGETERAGDFTGDLFDSNGSFEGAMEYSFEDGLAGGFTCENLSLSATPKLALRTTGHMSVEGPLESANVVGEFSIDEGRYVLTSSDWLTNSEVALSSAITLHRDGVELASAASEAPVFFEGWSVSLGVDLAQNTWIDVSMPLDDTFGSVTSAVSTVGLGGRLDGELDIDYTPEVLASNDATGEVLRTGGLDVVGELLVIRGDTKVFGKDFAVDDGTVRFTGGGLAEPELDISATHSNREYGDIVVDIAGQPRQMALAFSSSEGWSDTDMASILLLGRPVSSLTQSEGGAGLNLVGTALGVMAGTASNLVQMSSMVDSIEVESEGESISSLSVGWALGSDLFVTYSKDYTALEGDNITEITLEWLISKRIQAELSTGDRGQSSADLYMKWRF